LGNLPAPGDYPKDTIDNFKEVYNLENLGVDERIILKYTLKKEAGSMWTGLIGLRRGASGGTL
jgi:hypothetical protein